jgi:hypothetical protein
MTTCFKHGLLAPFAVGLAIVASGNAMAQSYLDGSAKMRGDYGQMSRRVITSRPAYTATAPSQTRSFSYEPSQAAPAPAPATSGYGGGNVASSATAAPAPTAQKDAGTVRSFSYEPSMRANSAPPARAQTPLYLVPKTMR